jgi:tetratricopeptide (TPR) repeat protein
MYYGLVCAASGRLAEAQRALANISRRFRSTDLAKLAGDIVNARLNEANGNIMKARDLYSAAAKLQDKMDFEDAPPWYFAPRELLAEMDLRDGDAAAAVTVAEADLKQHPNGVPALSLLATSYSELGRADDAARVRREVESAMTPQ